MGFTTKNKSHFKASRYSIGNDTDAFTGPSAFKQNKVINPEHKLKRRWDLLIVFFVIYNTVFLPLSLAFQKFRNENTWIIPFDYFVDICFLVDIILTFRTAYFDASLEIVTDPKMIAKTYGFSPRFMVDLLATFPFELVLSPLMDSSSSSSCASDSSSILFVFRLLRLVRILRIQRVLNFLNDLQGVYSTLVRIFQVVAMLVLFGHWFGCIFYSIAAVELRTMVTELQDQGKLNASAVDCDACVSDEGITLLEEQPWIVYDGTNLPCDDFGRQYAVSLYWAFTTVTSVGYGDFYPTTQSEYAVGIVMLLAGAIVYAVIIGSVSQLVSKLTASQQRYDEKIDSVVEYMACRKIPVQLQTQIKLFHQISWHRLGGYDENDILSELPFNLRHEMQNILHGDLLKRVGIFDKAGDRAVYGIINKMQPAVCGPKTIVVKQGNYGDELYILKKGVAEQIDENRIVIGLVTESGKGSCFGTDALLNQPYMLTVRSTGYCDLSVLTRTDFMTVMEDDNPELMEVVKELNNDRQARIEQQQKAAAKRTRRKNSELKHVAKTAQTAEKFINAIKPKRNLANLLHAEKEAIDKLDEMKEEIEKLQRELQDEYEDLQDAIAFHTQMKGLSSNASAMSNGTISDVDMSEDVE